MNKIIAVKSNIDYTTFDAFDESVKAASNKDAAIASLINLVNGKRLLKYQFNGESLELSLEDNTFLWIYIEQHDVRWQVLFESANVSDANNIEHVVFELPNGEQLAPEICMILDDFMGEQIAISASQQHLFIFSRDTDACIFSCLTALDDSGKSFLFLDEC